MSYIESSYCTVITNVGAPQRARVLANVKSGLYYKSLTIVMTVAFTMKLRS